MTKAKVASKALSWAMFFTIGGSVYGALLALGVFGLVFYNRWNYRKMKEERKAEDEYLAWLYGKEKARGRVYSWRDSFYGKFDGRRGPDQTMSDVTTDDDTSIGLRGPYPSVSHGVGSAVAMYGCPRESSQFVSTLGDGDGDMADKRYNQQMGSTPPTALHMQLPHHEKNGRRSPSMESVESWEA